MSGIIWLIGKAFVFIMELILDLICLALGIASLPAFWRWPGLFEAELRDRWAFRAYAAGNLLTVIFDVLTLPALLITTFSWRSCQMYSRVMGCSSQKFYNINRRLEAWVAFLTLMFLDIPCILALIMTHVTFWRIPFVWQQMFAAMPSESKVRLAIFENLGNGLLDIFLIPFALIILISVYRITITLDKIKSRDKIVEKKLTVIAQSLYVFLDFPFGLLLILTTCMVFRTRQVWQVWTAKPNKASERRLYIAEQFFKSLRDVLCIPFFFAVLGSIYRGVLCVKGLIDNISQWAPADEPDVIVTSAHLELPEVRGTGIILVVQGTKKPEFTLPSGTTLKLYIRNTDSFWPEVGRQFGDAADTVGRAMLPMNVSKYCDGSEVKQGDMACTIKFDLGSSVKCSTIRKNAQKMRCDVDIHVERGAHEATLFALSLKLNEFSTYVDGGDARKQLTVIDLAMKYDAETRKGKAVSDVFWQIVLLQFAMLLIDVFGVVCFVILHFFPHRAFRMYSLACARPNRAKLLKQLKELEKFAIQMKMHEHHFARAVETTDSDIRKLLSEQGTNGQKKGRGGYQQNDDYVYRRRRYGRGGRYVLRRHVKMEETSESILRVTFGDYMSELDSASAKCRSGGFTDAADVFRSLREKLVQHAQQFYLMVREQCIRDGVGAFGLRNVFPSCVPTIEDANPIVVVAAGGSRRENDPSLLHTEESADMQRAIEASLEEERQRTKAEASTEPIVEGAAAIEPQYSVAEVAGAEVATKEGPSMTSLKELNLSWDEQLRIHRVLVKSAISRVEAEANEQPWCGGKEGWPGARSVIFAEVAQVAYDIAAVLSFIFVFCTVYRSFYIIRSVWNSQNKRKACVWGLAEIAIDYFYSLKMFVVFLGVRGIFSLPADLVYYMMQRPSFATARQVIDHHLVIVLIDLMSVLSLVFAWDTLRFAVATMVFGAFSPGVLFESAFTKWEIASNGTASVSDKDICRAGLLLLVSMTWMFGVPIFVGYYVAEHSFRNAYIVFFVILAACMVIGILAAIALRDERTASLRRGVIKYLEPSIYNASTLFSLLLENIWLLAIVFSTSREDIYGESWGHGLEDASRYVFMLFGENWTSHGIPFGVFFSIVVSIIYFIVSAAPIVCGEMLHWRKSSRLIRSPVWTSLMQFLGQTISLLVARNLSAVLICDDASHTMDLSFGEMICWSGSARSVEVLAMILLSYYVPSCLMRNMRYDESICQSLDVAYPQLYKILINASNLTAICLCTILYSNRSAVCVIMMISSAWNLLWTTIYASVFNQQEGMVCSVKSIAMYRRVSSGFIFAASLLMLIRLNDGAHVSFWNLYATAAAIGVAIIVCAAYRVFLHRQHDIEDDSIDEIRETLLTTERSLTADGAMYATWSTKRSAWRSQVRSATRSSPLALLTCELEMFTMTFNVSKTFLAARRAWLEKAASVVSPVDANTQLTLNNADFDDDWRYWLLCCACCSRVCSHLDSGTDSDNEEPRVEESKRLEIVLEVVTALKNSTSR